MSPLFEFRCDHCGLTEEVLMRCTQYDEFPCSRGGGNMNRVPSSPAVHFKGSGFYSTDYAKPENKEDDRSS